MATMKIKTQKKNAKKVMSLGKVSIIMPNYNSANFVGESIQSIISQTYSNWTIIFSRNLFVIVIF